jgi:hypothetical protein
VKQDGLARIGQFEQSGAAGGGSAHAATPEQIVAKPTGCLILPGTLLNKMATTTFTKKVPGVEVVEPSVTPPPANATTFLKKPKIGGSKTRKKEIPEGLWTKCPKCEGMIYDKELDENLKVCPKCAHHFPIGSRERIHSLVDTC